MKSSSQEITSVDISRSIHSASVIWLAGGGVCGGDIDDILVKGGEYSMELSSNLKRFVRIEFEKTPSWHVDDPIESSVKGRKVQVGC